MNETPQLHAHNVGRRIGLALLGIASGWLLAECFPPHEWSLLAWVALVPIGLALAARTATFELYAGAFLGVALFHALGLDWVRTAYGESSSARSYRYWLLSVALNTSPWLVIFPLGRWITQSTRLPLSLLLPIAWLTFEFARRQIGWAVNEVPTPWLQIGATQIDCPWVAQIADLGGVWLVTALVACVNGAIADAILAVLQSVDSRQTVRSVWRAAALPACLLAAASLYGYWRWQQPLGERGPVVALMTSAPSIGSDPREPLGPLPPSDTLLWAEGAVSMGTDQALRDLQEFAKGAGSCCLLGCIREPRGSKERFNSVIALDLAGRVLGIYDKVFTVPWGEFNPSIGSLAGFRPAGFTRGQGPIVVATRNRDGRHLRVAPVICYDTAFPELFRQACAPADSAPDYFAVAASERVDGTLTVQRNMLNLTRWRAIECRRPIVRNADGGYSGWIDSRGSAENPQLMLDGPTALKPISMDSRRSLYTRYGDWAPWTAVTVFAALVARSFWCAHPPRRPAR